MINVSDVTKHLAEMKAVYDTVLSRNAIEIHQFLLDEEHNYVHAGAKNFAETVHMLHPVKYNADRVKYVKIVYIFLFCFL